MTWFVHDFICHVSKIEKNLKLWTAYCPKFWNLHNLGFLVTPPPLSPIRFFGQIPKTCTNLPPPSPYWWLPQLKCVGGGKIAPSPIRSIFHSLLSPPPLGEWKRIYSKSQGLKRFSRINQLPPPPKMILTSYLDRMVEKFTYGSFFRDHKN